MLADTSDNVWIPAYAEVTRGARDFWSLARSLTCTIPTSLQALNIPEQDIPKIADNAVALAKIWRMPDYDSERIQAILAGC